MGMCRLYAAMCGLWWCCPGGGGSGEGEDVGMDGSCYLGCRV